MKRKIISILLIIFMLSASLMIVPVNAATSLTKDGITVNATFDKAKYAVGDDMTLTVSFSEAVESAEFIVDYEGASNESWDYISSDLDKMYIREDYDPDGEYDDDCRRLLVSWVADTSSEQKENLDTEARTEFEFVFAATSTLADGENVVIYPLECGYYDNELVNVSWDGTESVEAELVVFDDLEDMDNDYITDEYSYYFQVDEVNGNYIIIPLMSRK